MRLIETSWLRSLLGLLASYIDRDVLHLCQFGSSHKKDSLLRRRLLQYPQLQWHDVIWQKSCFRLLPNINKLHTDDMLDRKGWIVNAGFSFCRVRVESISQNSPYPLLSKSSWIIIKIQLKLRGRPSALHDPWMTWRRKNESGMIAKAGNERFVGSFGGGGMAASF